MARAGLAHCYSLRQLFQVLLCGILLLLSDMAPAAAGMFVRGSMGMHHVSLWHAKHQVVLRSRYVGPQPMSLFASNRTTGTTRRVPW